MRRSAIILTVFFLFTGLVRGKPHETKLAEILAREAKKNFSALQRQEKPPYYIAYRVDDEKSLTLSAELGAISSRDEERDRILTVMVRIGSPQRDNFHPLREDVSVYYTSQGEQARLPYDDEPEAISHVVRLATENAYRKALARYSKVRANLDVKVAEDDLSPDYTMPSPRASFTGGSFGAQWPKLSSWKEELKRWSALFLNDPRCFSATAEIRLIRTEKTFVDTEGADIVQNFHRARLSFEAMTKADDGMIIPVFLSFDGESVDDFPLPDQVTRQVEQRAALMEALKNAPLVDPYSGPAILSGDAAGVFFHEIFGHRLEGQRMKEVTDSQTFKDKMGTQVLPADFDVVFDPTQRRFQGRYLWGAYTFDDEGVTAGPVRVVEKGILKDFLMSRTPIQGHPASNGHGRAQAGALPVARQSNMFITVRNPLTQEGLRERLVNELKKEGKPFGYRIDEVQGGFTMTKRLAPNAFNVNPFIVYRVYADGRPDELVRGVDLIGTPLSMFSHIEAGGGEYGVFSGFCGAESGSVPVAAVAPEIFVSQIELQKKGTSQSKPPLLDRPDKREEQ